MNISPDLPSEKGRDTDLAHAMKEVTSFTLEPEIDEVCMLARGNTTVFPREDNVYEKKESLAFDEA